MQQHCWQLRSSPEHTPCQNTCYCPTCCEYPLHRLASSSLTVTAVHSLHVYIHSSTGSICVVVACEHRVRHSVLSDIFGTVVNDPSLGFAGSKGSDSGPHGAIRSEAAYIFISSLLVGYAAPSQSSVQELMHANATMAASIQQLSALGVSSLPLQVASSLLNILCRICKTR